MAVLTGLRQKILNQPLTVRVLVGNSIVIIAGAIGGTLLTRYLTILGSLNLILFFTVLGLLLTLLVNWAIIRSALRPLHDVRRVVEEVQAGAKGLPEALLRPDGDPDIRRLVEAVDAMLGRLEQRTSQLHALSDRTINAQEEERRRIARNLHDETAQSLSMLIINLDRIEGALPPGEAELRNRVQDTRRLAAAVLEELRQIIFGLRPAMLDDLGLVPAIRWYGRSHLEEAGIAVVFEVPEGRVRLPHYLETTLFRIAQEAMNNISRHANAGQVTIRLWIDAENAFLEIEDNGCGFNVSRVTGQAVGRQQLGLLGIRERAALAGGQLFIDSEPGRGTCMHIALPIHRSARLAPEAAYQVETAGV